MSNRFYAVCGILDINGKILFVRHTYGPAKERILIPGGYVKEGELPSYAVKREIFEETGFDIAYKSLLYKLFCQFLALFYAVLSKLKLRCCS